MPDGRAGARELAARGSSRCGHAGRLDFPRGRPRSTTPTSRSPTTTTSRPCRRCCRCVDGAEVSAPSAGSAREWQTDSPGSRARRDCPHGARAAGRERRPGSRSTPAREARSSGEAAGSRRVELATPRTTPKRCSRAAGRTGSLRSCRRTERPRAARCATARGHAPDTVVAHRARPTSSTCTVEKVAINAVMAGCLPELMPVVLAAIEAICTDEFNIHGVLATTMPVGPVLVVNGPITSAIGMNSGSTPSARATAPTPRSAGRCSS